MATDVGRCPHCGIEIHGTKIKCHSCGRLLADVPQPPEAQFSTKIQRAENVLRTVAGDMPAGVFELETEGRRVINITEHVRRFAGAQGRQSGLLNIFVPHATAALAIMEVGSGSEADLGATLEQLAPTDDRYAHKHGEVGHGRDHLLPVFLTPALTLPVDEGDIALGEWQSIVVVDTNESNNHRKVRLSFVRWAESLPT